MVEDYYEEAAAGDDRGSALERTLTLKGKIPAGLHIRAASGKTLDRQGNKGFKVDDLMVTFTWFDGLEVVPRSASGDLIVPVRSQGDEFILRQRLEW
jgi:hypothetical protein